MAPHHHHHHHLHLHVRDLDRATAFYERWFGFCKHVEHGPLRFLRDPAGMDLALAPDPEPAALPPWFHFGFRLTDGEAVASLHEAMRTAEVPLPRPLTRYDDLVVFHCSDPDGYAIEVYWEPDPAGPTSGSTPT